MKLYYFETDKSHRPCAVARYLNSPVEFSRVDLHAGEHKKPDFLDANPNGKVPLLVDGDLNLFESDAIMAYLAVKAGSDLWPADSTQQIEVLRWLSWNANHFTRYAETIYFEHYVKPMFGAGEPDPAVLDNATGHVEHYTAILDAHLADKASIVDGGLSIADFAIGTLFAMDPDEHLHLSRFTNIARWHKGVYKSQGIYQPFP